MEETDVLKINDDDDDDDDDDAEPLYSMWAGPLAGVVENSRI